MITERLRKYEDAVKRRENRFRAFTSVVGQTATRRMRLDDARVLIGQIEEFHSVHGLHLFHQNIGKPTSAAEIPDLDAFAANLDQDMMNDAIRLHNEETERVRSAADALINALSDSSALAEFDDLLAVDRLASMIRLAELLPVLDADDDPPRRNEHRFYLSRMTESDAFFDPERISAAIDELPLDMTDDEVKLDQSVPDAQEQIAAVGARYGYDVTGPDAAGGIETALLQLVTSGHKFLGIFLGPAMMAIDDSNADTALGKALRAFLPPSVVGTANTVDDIATRLTEPDVQSQFNLGALGILGARVGFFLNVLAIGSELRSLARQPSFDSQAFRNAATAVLKSADTAIAAAQHMGYSLTRRGMRITAVIVTLPMLMLDGMAAAQGIGKAQRKADVSVAMGEAVKLAGSVIMTVASTYAAITGGALLSGPVGWAMAVGFALVLLGEFLISATSDPPLETFSKTCVFTNVSGATLTSDDPEEVQFAFRNGNNFDVRRQSEKLASIFHDPGFKASELAGSIKVEYRHEVAVTHLDGSTETVRTAPDSVDVRMRYIGKAGAIIDPPEAVSNFSPSTLQRNGVLTFLMDEPDRSNWRGGFFEFLVDLSPALPIRAYAKAP